MEQSNRNQGSTKMAVKLGGAGAVGGIGAVVLLATAALASAFVVGRNGRSSVKDRRCHKTPPGAIKEVVESDSIDEKPRVEEIDTCSIGPEKLESDAISDDSVVIIEEKKPFLDEKLQFELRNEDADNEIPEEGRNPEQVPVGGGRGESHEPTDEECDGEIKGKVDNGEALLCCDHEEIKVILADNSVDEEVHVDRKEAEEEVKETGEGELDEEKRSDNSKDGPLLDSPAMGRENVTVEIVKECEFIEEELLEDGQKAVLAELGSPFVGHENATGDEEEGRPFPTDTAEIEKECELIEEQLVEDVQKTILPLLGSLVVGHENATGDEKQGRPLPTDGAVEIVKECEFTEEQLVEDLQKKIMGVLLGNRHEDMNGDEDKGPFHVDTAEIISKDSGDADELIVLKEYVNSIEVAGDGIPADISIVSPMLEEEAISFFPEIIQVVKNQENDLEPEIVEEAEEEPISLETVKVTEQDNAMNEKVVENIKEINEKVVENSKEIEDGEKGENLTKESVDKTVLISDQVQLTYHELESKIQEDKAVKEVERDEKKQVHYLGGKALIGKYVADLAALTDSTNRRMMMIVTLSAVSSISCSCFFGLSFAGLCIVMFLTMVLSSVIVTE